MNTKKFSSILAVFLIIWVGFFATGCGGKTAAADYDLSQMSSTVAYTMVSKIYANPASYIGKSITIDGKYDKNTVSGTTYHFVYLNDVTNCCTASLEFVPTGKSISVNTKIRVSGKFEKYTEGPDTYYHIIASTVTKL
jgi:hypothetical protein